MNAQRLSIDIISTLPQSIIQTILCLLPIQEAARTSILSRDWRYKWTTIPKLDFIERKFEVSIDESQLSLPHQTSDAISLWKSVIKRCKLFNAIYQVLLMHQSPIHEFSLSVDPDVTCVNINQIILLLSRNLALNQLRLDCDYRIPLCIFNGFGNLTSLYLYNCNLYFESTFNGFGRLTSLYLDEVICPLETLLHLVSNCPLFKALVVDTSGGYFPISFVYLKQHLCLNRLKYLCLEYVSFIYGKGLPSFFLLIRSSPNLEKIKLEMCIEDPFYPQAEIDSITLEHYSDIWLEHLTELEIEGMNYIKPEWEFVRFILAKSPVLKKLTIRIFSVVIKDDEIKILRILPTCITTGRYHC